MENQLKIVQERVNAALNIMSVAERLNFYDLAFEGHLEQAYEYMLKCVFNIAIEQLKEEDMQAYNELVK